ncbi:hypothetical protein Tco_0109331 [Tanacetum coccineum]
MREYEVGKEDSEIEFPAIVLDNNVKHADNNISYEPTVNSIRRTAIQKTHTSYSAQYNTAYLSTDTENRLTKEITMATHDLDGTHTTPCLAKPNLAKTKTNNFKLEISKEMLKLLCDNAYNGADANDAIDHITIFLEIMDLVRIQSVDPEQLRIFAFQYPLIENAHKWWMPEVNHMITSWEELVNKLFYKYYLLSRAGYDNTTLFDDEESSDDDDNKLNHINHHDINPLLNPYPSVKDEGTKSHHMMCNDNNSGPKNFVQNDAPHSGNNNQGNEGLCRVDKFEVIKYSIVDNEEFMGIRTLERDSWAQTINGISNIYLDIFYKKDEGWIVSERQSEALFNILFAQTLIMENHMEQNIRGVSSS